jgi:hypothetical protein
MMSDSINPLFAPGSCIRVVYSADGLEMFAIGVILKSGKDHLTLEQYSDQYGPVAPFRLAVRWSAIIRLTVNGAVAENRARRLSESIISIDRA